MARLATALACLVLAAPALATAQDAPISTVRDPAKEAAAAAAKPTIAPIGAAAVPTDDYGYVAWCYGAVNGYIDQYPTAMPEVIRIERAFPTPSTEDNIKNVYPAQRDAAKASLPLYRAAIDAAEKASARPISDYGAQSISRGRAVWSGYAAANKARLAQFWMGWAAPADCDTRAKGLKAKSDLMGQALSFNNTAAGETLAAPAEAPAPNAAVAPASIDDLLTAAPAEEASAAKVADATSVKPKAKPAPKLRGTR